MLQCCFHLCQSPAVLAAMAAGARPFAAQSSDWLSHALWKNMERGWWFYSSGWSTASSAAATLGRYSDCTEKWLPGIGCHMNELNDFLSFSPLAVQLFRFHSVEHECTHGNRSVGFCRPVWKVDCKIATAILEKQISHFQNDGSESFLFVNLRARTSFQLQQSKFPNLQFPNPRKSRIHAMLETFDCFWELLLLKSDLHFICNLVSRLCQSKTCLILYVFLVSRDTGLPCSLWFTEAAAAAAVPGMSQTQGVDLYFSWYLTIRTFDIVW